ncbi:MAG: hypothetical protein ACAF41_25710 [Leptolyngbya sp. BL-A-14]
MAKAIFMTVFGITVLTILTLGFLGYKDGGFPGSYDRTKLERLLCQHNFSRCE